jgi:hypothetical protein
MKPIMKQACLLFSIIIFFVQPAHALLRFHKKQVVSCHAAEPRYQRLFTGLSYLHPGRPRLRGPRLNPDDRYNIVTEGVFSFVCALLSLVCLAAAGITSFPILVTAVFLFGILAAIFGAIGIRRIKPGYAIIGLVLGILAITGGFMVLAVM